ncbi:hypothetical protein EPUL_004137 [Erysiphe pulchra]|uniref:Zn(2)-C6 fungal-type domain-containing protein n=1 Tax=Erysiphe pulchra TaxID=225359 RepID=A0A2S4PNZ6_9PEZI|nr:hypothetical protein EPUL_004137 [Erysiphe pulchra]
MAPKVIQSRTLKRQRSDCSDGEDSDTTPRKQYKRVSKACERCRLKKTKCDGEIPCQRCTNDMVVCCEGTRKKGRSKTVAESCVELLECQQNKLIAGHLKMYKIMVDAGIWSFGEVRKNIYGMPVVHDILEKLGIMRLGTEFPNGFPENADENRAFRRQLEAAKIEDITDKYKDEFQRITTQSSPPSLTHTDRESSIETCISEVKPSEEINFNTLTSSHVVNQILGFQQDFNISNWNFELGNIEKKEDSVAALAHLTMFSSTNTLSYDQKPQSTPKALLQSDIRAKNGIGTNHLITDFNSPVQSLPQTSIRSLAKNGNLINTQASFNDEQSLMSINLLDYMEPNDDIMSIGMKYIYDPYMGQGI